jgi:hypothetical protein
MAGQGTVSRWQYNNLIPYDRRNPVVDRQDFHTKPSELPSFLSHALIWLTFGFGATMTMVGLREVTRAQFKTAAQVEAAWDRKAGDR